MSTEFDDIKYHEQEKKQLNNLVDAIRNNNINAIKHSLNDKQFDNDETYKDHLVKHTFPSPLIFAVSSRVQVKTLETLVEKGANLSKINPWNGFTLLHHLCWTGCELPVLNFLLDKIKLSVHATDHEHKTPLHHLMGMVRDTKLVKCLLEKGACPSVPDEYGDTPLHTATLLLDPNDENIKVLLATIEILLKYGADPNYKNCYGDSPIDNAREGHEQYVQIIENNTKKKLIEKNREHFFWFFEKSDDSSEEFI